MTTIRFVSPNEWGVLSGKTADMPWVVAKERFISAFKDRRHGEALYEHVEEMHGCRASNGDNWAVAMNSVIKILNGLPINATEEQLIQAFVLQGK